jgi:penicillin amidase
VTAATVSNRRGRRRVGLRVALLVAALIALVFAIGWGGSALRERSLLHAAFPQATGTIRLRGLDAPVVVDRDARGVPHVRAESERDAFFALGFVHAQDRLGQMLWLERLARGTSAEVIGPEGLAWDRRARAIGFGNLADAQIERLASRTRRVLEAYAAGVNARIDRIVADEVGAPLAVHALDLPLQTWEPADSLAVFKAFAWGLGASVDASLVLQELIQDLGAATSRPFFPKRARETAPAARTTAQVEDAVPHRGVASPDPLRRALGMFGPSVGSSAWVIGGAHTATGHPVLVADSHLAPTVPPHLHLDHLHADDLDVAGTTLPGVPVFWTGRNERVAWACVHAGAVVIDLFEETIDSDDPSRHHDGRSWRPLAERVEVLRVRGGADEEMRVASTRHGPLLPGRDGRDPISVAWTGARIEGPSGIGSLLGVARAANADEIVEALRQHHEPVLAVAFADAHGEAGMQVAGWIPRRALSPGLLPLPGRARWYDWSHPVPFESLPRTRLSAGKGWVVVADAPFSSGQEDEPIEWLWRSGEGPGVDGRRWRARALSRGGRGGRDPARLRWLRPRGQPGRRRLPPVRHRPDRGGPGAATRRRTARALPGAGASRSRAGGVRNPARGDWGDRAGRLDRAREHRPERAREPAAGMAAALLQPRCQSRPLELGAAPHPALRASRRTRRAARQTQSAGSLSLSR